MTKEQALPGIPILAPRRTHYSGYCELYPVRQGKGLFSDRAAGYGNHENECGEEVEMSGVFAW